jgi:ComF family protein
MPVTGAAQQCGRCITHPPPLDACMAGVPYAYPWAGLLTRFKFNQQPQLALALAGVLRHIPGIEPAIDRADLILPMPLSAQRLQSRGFNQALLLARGLGAGRRSADQGRRKIRADLLLRLQDTPAQTSLDRAHRLVSVRNAFAVAPLLAPQLKGQSVLLIDDVMTTGASLFAAANTLRQAGAGPIAAAVVARTP